MFLHILSMLHLLLYTLYDFCSKANVLGYIGFYLIVSNILKINIADSSLNNLIIECCFVAVVLFAFGMLWQQLIQNAEIQKSKYVSKKNMTQCKIFDSEHINSTNINALRGKKWAITVFFIFLGCT